MYDSKLEKTFHSEWKKHSKFPLKPQHKFHCTRQWRFDFAHLPTLTAIEIQGFGEGHTSYEGMASDYAKHNEALRYGWIIIYIMSKDIDTKRIAKTIRYIESIITQRPITKPTKPSTPTPRNKFEEVVERLLKKP